MLYLVVVSPFRFTSNLVPTVMAELYLIVMAIIVSQYAGGNSLKTTLDTAGMAVSLLVAAGFTGGFIMRDTWLSLV